MFKFHVQGDEFQVRQILFPLLAFVKQANKTFGDAM